MKKLLFLTSFLLVTSLFVTAQLKKDGTPDMRFKANKQTYGDSYSAPSYPTYSTPKKEKNYDNGGQITLQKGYVKDNGTYVEPHYKTKPDNKTWNNLSESK